MTTTPLADAITDRIAKTFALWHRKTLYDSDVREVLVIEKVNLQSIERKLIEARETLELILRHAYTPQPCPGWSDEMNAALEKARKVLAP